MSLRTWSFIVVLLTICAGAVKAQIPSERHRMGLNGPVRAMRLESHMYSWEDGRWRSFGMVNRTQTRFDRYGRCLTPLIDPGSGRRAFGLPHPPATADGPRQYELVQPMRNGMGWKTLWRFDAQGRLERFEAYGLYESGPSLSHWEQYFYDGRGRIREVTYWVNRGRSPGQTEPYPPIRIRYWFDQAGRIGGWVNRDDPNHRCRLTYDGRGRLVKGIEEKADGAITHVTTETWSGYDPQGNWTVRTVTTAWRTVEEEELRERRVTRRSISYPVR